MKNRYEIYNIQINRPKRGYRNCKPKLGRKDKSWKDGRTKKCPSVPTDTTS